MTKVMLYPFLEPNARCAEKCGILYSEQNGFLTDSTFLPWRSVIIPADICTSFMEEWEELCCAQPLIHLEGWEERCNILSLIHLEGWES